MSRTTGSGSAPFRVLMRFVAGLSAQQAGAVTIAFTGVGNNPGPINVTLNSISPAAATAPVGSFDTPVDGTTGIAGSLAVTGWAVDDVEATRVTICRDPVSGESVGRATLCGGLMRVYIGAAE